MLKDKPSSAIVAVKDIARARDFYSNTLGLELDNEMDDVLAYRTGTTSLVVYRSDEAGTNKANAVVWDVGSEIDSITADLKAKGVEFEHYPELFGGKMDGDIHVADDFRAVWFKDPDGNILAVGDMGM